MLDRFLNEGGRKVKIRFGIRSKILIPFLALAFISLGVTSSLAFRTIYEVSYLVKEQSVTMAEDVTRRSIFALEDLGRRLIQRQAWYTANQLVLFLQEQPLLDVSTLRNSPEAGKIAVQQVGLTGYTFVYDRHGVVYFHPDRRMVGVNLLKVGGEPVYFSSIVERSFLGETSGYYEWEDESNEERQKYMHCVPVGATGLVVAAVTYIDEYSSPAEQFKEEISQSVLETSEYVDKQLERAQLVFVIVFSVMVLVAVVVIVLLSRAITRPILALTKGAEVVGRGELDYKIKMETGDEIQQLAEQFNAMTMALKESYADLERKVEERTRQERLRAEQLRTLNEVSRKISSVVKLDELLLHVGNLLRETFNYHNVNIFLLDPESGGLVLKAVCLSGQKAIIPVEVPLEVGGSSIVGWVAQTGEPILANDISEEPRYKAVEALKDIKSELAVPVKLGDKVLGILDIESTEVDAFDEADLFTAQTLADQLAIAIENARLYEETRHMAVMEERNRMAREIHDTLAQGFSGIIMQLEAAEQALGEDMAAVERHINQARSLARKSLAEARRSVWNLRPQALEQFPLPEALKHEVDKFAQVSGVSAEFQVVGAKRSLPAEVEAVLLRICQEALTNVRKHAGASEVEVRLVFDEEAVELVVSDNGRGFEAKVPSEEEVRKRGTFGLISMRERARSIGGHFEILSESGKGTIVRVTVPLQEVGSGAD